jgi:hypothetical protein
MNGWYWLNHEADLSPDNLELNGTSCLSLASGSVTIRQAIPRL